MIYFLECEGHGLVKIGQTAASITNRIQQIQHASPFVLTLIGAHHGDQSTEADLHKRFSKHRHRGEWFRICPEILAHIEAMGGVSDYTNGVRHDLRDLSGVVRRKKWPSHLKAQYAKLENRRGSGIRAWRLYGAALRPEVIQEIEEMVFAASNGKAAA